MTRTKHIRQWLQDHPYFKFSSLCTDLKFDKSNLCRIINDQNKELPDKYIAPIEKALSDYGYVKITDELTMPTNKDQSEEPKSILPINSIPKTLDQLKALCPPDLVGLDKSEWIRLNRVKYNI